MQPMKFPVVFSRHLYLRPNKHMHWYTHMDCDGSWYIKELMEFSKMRGIPGVRTSCEVLVYIVPHRYSIWRFPKGGNLFRLEEFPDLLPLKMMDMTATGEISDWSTLISIRSGHFTVFVGRSDIRRLPIDQSTITKLVIDKIYGSGITVPTKLFIQLIGIRQGILEVCGIYLITNPSYAQVPLGLDKSYQRMYEFTKLKATKLTTELEYFVGTEIQKVESLWLDICATCVVRNGYIPKSELTRLSTLSDMPAREHVFLNSLFPNSSIISGLDFFISHGHYNFPTVLRSSIAINATLLFRPLSQNDGYQFVTCCSIAEVGGLSLFALISAYDQSTWIWIFIIVIAAPTLLINLILRARLSDAMLNSISILLEQGCFHDIWKRSKWVGGVCLLMGVILSNSYRGDNITSLTAPRAPPRLERYDQLFLRCYFVSIEFTDAFIAVINDRMGSNPSENFKHGVFREIMRKVTIWMRSALGGGFSEERTDVAYKIFSNVNWPANMAELLQFSDFRYFLPRLAKCGAEAFVGHRLDVPIMSQLLQGMLVKHGKPKQVVSVGKESFSRVAPTWQLSNVHVPWTYLFKRVHSL